MLGQFKTKTAETARDEINPALPQRRIDARRIEPDFLIASHPAIRSAIGDDALVGVARHLGEELRDDALALPAPIARCRNVDATAAHIRHLTRQHTAWTQQ